MKYLSFKALVLAVVGICTLSCDSFMPDSSLGGTGSGETGEITPKPDNDEFVILFTNDFHSQIETADTGEYGLDKYITRRDSPEYVRDYFGEITGPLDGRVRYE